MLEYELVNFRNMRETRGIAHRELQLAVARAQMGVRLRCSRLHAGNLFRLAARLSENPSVQVALIEAGPDFRSADAPEAMRIPNPSRIITDAEYAHLRYDDLMARRTSAQTPRRYWRGRGVGGSSSINGSHEQPVTRLPK